MLINFSVNFPMFWAKTRKGVWGVATKRWILQGMHSETVHHIPVYNSTEHVA
jgi:hypothetical protein